MSTKIKGFISDTNVEYQKHKKVFLACKEAGVDLPKQTAEYFGSDSVDVVEDDLLEGKLEMKLQLGVHFTNYSADMQDGFEVDLTKLPQGVTKLRFYNSY